MSPRAEIIARRLATLAKLAAPAKGPLIVLTTINAVLQRVVPKSTIASATFAAVPSQSLDSNKLIAFLAENGFSRTGTVVDPGDFAVRGGIIDIFPPGAEAPIRLDFFGDTLESIRSFDPQSQRSTVTLKRFALNPANEVLLTTEAISRFRMGYAEAFGGIDISDPLYESITSGRRYQGQEHWMPLFHAQLDTIFDYLPDAVISLDFEIGGSHDRPARSDRRVSHGPPRSAGQAELWRGTLQAAESGGTLSIPGRIHGAPCRSLHVAVFAFRKPRTRPPSPSVASAGGALLPSASRSPAMSTRQ